MSDVAEVGEIEVKTGVGFHVEVVAFVSDVSVLRDQVHVEEADVHVDVAASFPPEVKCLRHIREVEWRL